MRKRKEPPNLVLAEEVAVGILHRMYHHPKIPIYKADIYALDKASETFRKAHKRLRRMGEGGCDYLRSWICGLGNKRLKIKRDSSLLPESIKEAIVKGHTEPCS
jgi:hypothetical protein